MKLWLDDVRHPADFGCLGWHWAKTADEAIAALQAGEVTEASLDHDLCFEHHVEGENPDYPFSGRTEKTGYGVVVWMERNNVWPPNGVRVHSMNPPGKQRMLAVIERHYDHVSIDQSREDQRNAGTETEEAVLRQEAQG